MNFYLCDFSSDKTVFVVSSRKDYTEKMYTGVIRALLVASLLVAATVHGKSLQNFDANNPRVDFSSIRYSPTHANIIGFNNQNFAMPHSSNNFNPLSSSLVSASQPVFRPSFSNRNSFSPSVHRPVSFGRPLPVGNRRFPRIPASQNNGISFNNNRNQQGGSSNAGVIHFGGPVDTPVSFSNKPTEVVLPSQPTKSPGVPRVPISFGGGHVVHPDSAPSISSEPVVTNVPDMFFPGGATESTEGERESVTTDFNFVNAGETPDCLLKHGTVNFNGNCEILLSRASCPEDHWLLIDVTGSPYCAKRHCPWGQLNYLEDCVDPRDTEVCPRGQIMYVEYTGLVECDCEPEFMFDDVSGNCYEDHEQGFCDDGFHLEQGPSGNVSCVPNPCVSDNFVEQDGVCYEKNYRGYCPQSQVMILPELFTADCQFLVPHSIFQVPNLSACPPGSRRDFFNNCRGIFRVPTQSSFPTLRGDCPTDFVKDPRGTCRRVVNLFG